MPIEAGGQIWIFCDAGQPAGTGSLVYFLDPPRPGKEAGELTSQ
jgi:hypothetical protein